MLVAGHFAPRPLLPVNSRDQRYSRDQRLQVFNTPVAIRICAGIAPNTNNVGVIQVPAFFVSAAAVSTSAITRSREVSAPAGSSLVFRNPNAVC